MATRISGRSRSSRGSRLDPRKTPVQDRSRATIECILTAAAQVFEEVGYAAGTTNRIADRAGVSVGTIYQYFPNKDALAVLLLERHIQQGTHMFEELLDRARGQRLDLRGTLRMFVEGMLELHAAGPRLQHLLLEEAPRPPRLEAELLRAEASAVQAIAKLLRSHADVPRRRLEPAAYVTVHAVEDLTNRFVAHPPSGVSRRQFATELVTMLEAYLTPSNGLASKPPCGT
jgi:AcrR family transcriptional regulator